MRRAMLVLVAGLMAVAPAAHADLPRSFVGVYDESPAGLVDQARLGIGVVRQPFDWSVVERDGWGAYDDYVAQAATAGVSVLPILARRPELGPPSSKAAYAAFVRDAVERYGPSGSFWRDHSDVPFL